MKEVSFIDTFQHQEHRKWLSTLDFYQDEIKIFQHELLQVLHRHPNLLGIIEHVDEYRRIFLKKLEHIDDFRHRIILHERALVSDQISSITESRDHSEAREEIFQFFKDFETLKGNFRRFVAHNN